MQQKPSTIGQWFRPLLAVLLVALVLLSSLAASSASLHKLLHSDAGEAGHQCVISLFSHGHVQAPTAVALLVVAAPVLVCLVLRAELPLAASASYRVSSSRAPPALL